TIACCAQNDKALLYQALEWSKAMPMLASLKPPRLRAGALISTLLLLLGPTAVSAQASAPAPVHYDAYIPAATKAHQEYHYSCEFDAAWVVLKTYGIDSNVDDLIALVGVDTTITPTYQLTAHGYVIHGGDITQSYS